MHVSDISRKLILVVSAVLLVVGGLAGSAIAGGFSAKSAGSGHGRRVSAAV